MKKITMIDNLTVYVNKREYKIEIDEKFTSISSLDDLEDLEQSFPGFFDIESISKQNNKIYLVYNLPEEYEPLVKAKKYVSVIKLQLIKNLLDADPLYNSDGMTYLDLNNIFFKNFSEVKILYRSNGYIPYPKDLNNLDQYKLFVLGFYSNKYSYKKFLINKDNLLRKENNEFMFAVNATTSFVELKTLVEQELEKEKQRFYKKIQFRVTSEKKGIKRKMYLLISGVLLLGLLFIGGIKQVEKNVAADYENKLAEAKVDNELVLAVSGGDTKKAEALMKKKGEDSAAIANMLLKAGKYDEAISYDNSIEKKVVERLYTLGQKEKILELKSNSTFLTYEKAIVDFNVDNLVNIIPLIQDKDTMKRLALSFIEHEEFEYAKDVLERLKSSPDIFSLNKKENKELNQYIKKANLEIKVRDLNEQISTLSTNDTFEESEEESIKREKEKLESELTSVQKDLIKIDEKLGMNE